MKKITTIATVFLFIATFLLNLSVDSKGNFTLIKTAQANYLGEEDYKGPSDWYCYTDGRVTSTLIVCTDEGGTNCSPTTPCP